MSRIRRLCLDAEKQKAPLFIGPRGSAGNSFVYSQLSDGSFYLLRRDLQIAPWHFSNVSTTLAFYSVCSQLLSTAHKN